MLEERGWNKNGGSHVGDKDDESTGGSKTQALRWSLIIGGESMDEQFQAVASNPDMQVLPPIVFMF